MRKICAPLIVAWLTTAGCRIESKGLDTPEGVAGLIGGLGLLLGMGLMIAGIIVNYASPHAIGQQLARAGAGIALLVIFGLGAAAIIRAPQGQQEKQAWGFAWSLASIAAIWFLFRRYYRKS